MTPNNDLSALQQRILRSLPLNPPFIATLGCDEKLPTVSRAIARLEARGLVRRVRKNGRTVQVVKVDVG